MSYALISGDVIASVTGGVFTYHRTLTMSDTLLNSPVSILRTYMIVEGVGDMTLPTDKDDWPLYASSMPDGTNVKTNCGALYDTSGIKDGRLMEGPVIQHHGIQLRIRSSTYEIGWTKAEAIVSVLDAVYNGEVSKGGEDYQILNIGRGPIISLGLERGTRRRYLFTVNFVLTIKKVS